MRKSLFKYILLGTFLFAGVNIHSQHFLRVDGRAIVNENQDTILLRGMGLGGWMLQEGYMLQTAEFANAQYQIREKIDALIGPEMTDMFYEAWLNNHVTKTDIDSLKSWGFNSVRLPMHYNLFTLPIEDESVMGQQTWLDKGFELTDSLISWCKQNEMYVILDLHAAPGGQGQDQGISDYDPAKPSLWQSQENRDKTATLWKKLAERYAEEPLVAGYDLINEPNWNLPQNISLKNLYQTITDSIRSVDTKHILFIEGNWFANDFTGLTPPWDDNMVYSPHKYWTINDQASIQWVLDLQDMYNVPLYFGESGENSNVWFRDAIRLFEDNNIGWAWWPMKKVESISGPLSVIKTEEYQELLDYWDGNGSQPSVEQAISTLMELTENLKIENCFFQKDVIDAMFRQVYSDETKPYITHEIPGIVYASNYDMGVIGKAYHDNESANYHLSTGSYVAWNTGWAYRNDGVDIEVCEDKINTNGYNAGWIDTDEWMQYDIDVKNDAVYDILLRVSALSSSGQVKFLTGDAEISRTQTIPSTGDWENWASVIIPDVILSTQDQKLKLFVESSGFNISSFEFIEKGPTSSLPTSFVTASTLDASTIQMTVNKHLQLPLPQNLNSFTIYADDYEITITDVTIDPDNNRMLLFSLEQELSFDQHLQISYSGNQVVASDAVPLSTFNLEKVTNALTFFYPIPGRLEPENYFSQSGVQLETTTDIGGGQNIGFLDVGDYLDYKIDVQTEGEYTLEYRTASQSAIGGVQLSLIDETGQETILDSPNFPSTGGWQTWRTHESSTELPMGRYTLRILITQAPFNMNWIDFSLINPPEDDLPLGVDVYPNPSSGLFYLNAGFSNIHSVTVEIFDLLGKSMLFENLGFVTSIDHMLSLFHLPNGIYLMYLSLEDGKTYPFKLNKVSEN